MKIYQKCRLGRYFARCPRELKLFIVLYNQINGIMLVQPPLHFEPSIPPFAQVEKSLGTDCFVFAPLRLELFRCFIHSYRFRIRQGCLPLIYPVCVIIQPSTITLYFKSMCLVGSTKVGTVGQHWNPATFRTPKLEFGIRTYNNRNAC
jgi:hypothetical protein